LGKNIPAIIFEGKNGDSRSHIQDLYREVSPLANVLTSMGVKKGDRLTIYLP